MQCGRCGRNSVRDHYPKYVVTLNSMDTGIENGVKIIHLADFLLEEKW